MRIPRPSKRPSAFVSLVLALAVIHIGGVEALAQARTTSEHQGRLWRYVYEADGPRHVWVGDREVALEKADGTVEAYAYDSAGRKIQTRITKAGAEPRYIEHRRPPAQPPLVPEPRESPPAVADAARAAHDTLTTPTTATLASTTSSLCDGSSDNGFAFNGYRHDCETGLHLTPSGRMYDSAVGRFVQQDSYLGDITTPASLHRYMFANANPTRYTDPTGHWSWEAFGKGLANLPRAVAEPGLWVYDTTLVAGARALDIPFEHIALQSAMGRRAQGRIEAGQSSLAAATKGAVESTAATFSFGTTSFAQGQYEAYQDFETGRITLDEYDYRLSSMAGTQAGAAALAAGYAQARTGTWTGRVPSDQAMIDNLVGERARHMRAGTLGLKPGDATLAQGRTAIGRTTPVRESIRSPDENPANAVHAEPQVNPGRGGTIAVDQYPCSVCRPELEVGGVRVIVPRNPLKPGQSPKSAAEGAALGKNTAEPKVVIEGPHGSVLVPATAPLALPPPAQEDYGPR